MCLEAVRSSAARSRPAADRRLRDAHQVRAWPESPPIQDIVVQRRDRTVTACANRPALDSHVTRGMDVGEAAGIIYITASPEVALSRETAGGRSLDPDNSRVGIIGEARRRSPRRRPISCGNRPFHNSGIGSARRPNSHGSISRSRLPRCASVGGELAIRRTIAGSRSASRRSSVMPPTHCQCRRSSHCGRQTNRPADSLAEAKQAPRSCLWREDEGGCGRRRR